MKSSTFPSLDIDASLRGAAEEVLAEGESLSGFIDDSVRANIDRRVAQREFIARGLASLAEAERTGRYRSAAEVIAGLRDQLAQAKAKAAVGK